MSQAAPPKLLAAVLAEKMTDEQMEELDKARKRKAINGQVKQDLVYKMICSADWAWEEGLQRHQIALVLNGKMSKKEVDDALDYLSGEGHIYSTIDDDHFKAIDS